MQGQGDAVPFIGLYLPYTGFLTLAFVMVLNPAKRPIEAIHSGLPLRSIGIFPFLRLYPVKSAIKLSTAQSDRSDNVPLCV